MSTRKSHTRSRHVNFSKLVPRAGLQYIKDGRPLLGDHRCARTISMALRARFGFSLNRRIVDLSLAEILCHACIRIHDTEDTTPPALFWVNAAEISCWARDVPGNALFQLVVVLLGARRRYLESRCAECRKQERVSETAWALDQFRTLLDARCVGNPLLALAYDEAQWVFGDEEDKMQEGKKPQKSAKRGRAADDEGDDETEGLRDAVKRLRITEDSAWVSTEDTSMGDQMERLQLQE